MSLRLLRDQLLRQRTVSTWLAPQLGRIWLRVVPGTDKAYCLIERAEGDPFLAWSILQEKFMATDAEENFPDLSEAFANCKLNETKKDPELWFNDLDHFNMRIGCINKKYKKDDLQMKSHIMTSMSSGYDPVVLMYRGELATTPLVKLRKEITLQYKALVKVGSKNKSESAMVANVNKHPYKKFKGTCRNRGKIGHKADECRSAKSETAVAVDKAHVTCFNCQEKGHYANKCTKPNKDKTAANNMAMLVGVAGVKIGGTIVHATTIPSTDSLTFLDTLFDDWADDSWDEEHGFDDVGEFQSFYADSTTSEDPVMVEIEELPYAPVAEEHSEHVNVITVSEEFVGSVGVDGNKNSLLDSGATCGVTYDKSNMTNMRGSDKKITIGNGAKIATLGQGTVTLIDALGTLVTLTDVYYAPKFTKHVVSLWKLIDDDWKLDNADKSEFVLTDPNKTTTVRFGRNNNDQLYYLSSKRTSCHEDEAVHSLPSKPVSLDINIAHGLLGHPDTRTVKAMAARQNWTLTGSVLPCGSCALAKVDQRRR